MEDAITKLRNERTALRQRLEKVDAAIAEYERWAASVADLIVAGDPETHHTIQDKMGTPVSAEDEAVATQSPINEFEDSVRMVLEEAARPYQRGPLLSAIENLGIVISGKNPTNTMGTRLSRMDDIINLKGHGYWLKSRAYPDAEYWPNDDKDEDSDTTNLI